MLSNAEGDVGIRLRKKASIYTVHRERGLIVVPVLTTVAIFSYHKHTLLHITLFIAKPLLTAKLSDFILLHSFFIKGSHSDSL